MIWSSLWPFALFAVGVVIVIWATERLLEGLVGLAGLLRVSIFAIAAVLSGFEAENVAVGLAAARREAAELALGTVFGGAIFLVCVALGLGTLLYPLRVTLPRGFLFLMAICPLLVGAGLIGENEPPGWGGVARRLCGRYRLPRACLSGPRLSGVRGGEGGRGRATLLHRGDRTYDRGASRDRLRRRTRHTRCRGHRFGARALDAFGRDGGDPTAIEIEEVFRQAVPAREGRPEVSAGNLVGTLLYFLWFKMGLISLLLPVRADPLVVRLDWPYLVGVTWLATLFFARGRVGRLEGALLVVLYGVYVVLHTVLR